jgi:hypothetical protein
LLALPVLMVRLVSMVLMARLALPVSMVRPVPLVLLELMVRPVPLALPVPLVPLALPVSDRGYRTIVSAMQRLLSPQAISRTGSLC